MAHKRFISSTMSIDEKLAPIAAKNVKSALMWPWLLMQFDDWGRAKYSPMTLKLSLFPAFFEISVDDIAEAVCSFEEQGLIYSYQVDGKTYLAVRPKSWIKYQTYLIGTKRAGNDSSLPCPSDAPWPLEEEIDMRVAMTRSPEKSKAETLFKERFAVSADNQKCQLTNGDVSRQSEMSADGSCMSALAVPSPSPSLRTKTSNRGCGYVDNSQEEEPETQSQQGERAQSPTVDKSVISVDNVSGEKKPKKGTKPDAKIVSRIQTALVKRSQLTELNQNLALTIVDRYGESEGMRLISQAQKSSCQSGGMPMETMLSEIISHAPT